jgi:hypothetical protein
MVNNRDVSLIKSIGLITRGVVRMRFIAFILSYDISFF